MKKKPVQVIITFTARGENGCDMKVKCIPPMKMKDGKAQIAHPVYRIASDFLEAIKETYEANS